MPKLSEGRTLQVPQAHALICRCGQKSRDNSFRLSAPRNILLVLICVLWLFREKSALPGALLRATFSRAL